jgi:IS30 family transposase
MTIAIMTGNLKLEHRIIIQTMKYYGHKISEIADYIGCAVSTIYRELKKLVGESDNYDAHIANAIVSNSMIRESKQAPSEDVIEMVDDHIRKEFSPDQINKRFKLLGLSTVSHTWIYKHIEKDKINGGTLHKHLRHGKYEPKNLEYKGKIPNRVPIEDRPAIVDDRDRLGDYEIDLIVGVKNRGAILSIVDRSSRQCWLQKLTGKTAIEVEEAIVAVLDPYKGYIHTITTDNGNEFINHERIAKKLETKYYFAHPYASYERGSVENLNGLVRQYIPKGTDFNDVEEYTVKMIENKLNNRPRKTLGYYTPLEVSICKKKAA